jgi:putative phosphoesterase
MRIGLISDTRVLTGEEVPQQVVRAFEGVELILHAGGIQTSAVLDWLEQIAPVKAAGRIHGRHVESRQAPGLEGEDDPRVAEQQILNLEGHTIGLVNELWFPPLHDEVLPGVLEAHHLPDEALPKLLEEYFGVAVDIVVFGRTLYTLVEEHQGVLFVNPGSPSLPKSQRKLGNVAILDLTPGNREATIIDLAASG